MARYRAGYFTAPGSTGNQTVTFDTTFSGPCQGVIFFGCNSGTLDSVVSDANAGAFMGMMATDDTLAILAFSQTIIPNQFQEVSQTEPILSASNTSVFEYRAAPVSMDAAGFTVNWTVVPGSTRYIQYLAWGDAVDSTAAKLTSPYSTTITTGFQVTSGFSLGGYTGATYPIPTNFTFAWFQGMAYSLATYPNHFLSSHWATAGEAGGNSFKRLGTFDTSLGFHGYGFEYIVGVLVQDLKYALPNAGSPTTGFDVINGSPFVNTELYALWDEQADADSTTPAAAVPNTVTHAVQNVSDVDAIVLFGMSGNQGSTQNDPNLGCSFGFKTANYQGCVTVDYTGNLYQSLTKGWCSKVDGSGAHAGTLEINGSDLVFTTEVDGTTAASLSWVAYGGSGFDGPVTSMYWRARSG